MRAPLPMTSMVCHAPRLRTNRLLAMPLKNVSGKYCLVIVYRIRRATKRPDVAVLTQYA